MRPHVSLSSRAALALLLPTATFGALVAVPGVASAAAPGVGISEVAPWGSSTSTPYQQDWWELTNYGSTAVSITGWKMDDNHASFAAADALTGVTSIAPGESVIFIETTGATAATVVTNFRNTWSLPASVQVGTYSGSSVGLSQSGDAVNVYNGSGTLQASVYFGASPSTFTTFTNPAGADFPDTSHQLATTSVSGQGGAYTTTDNEVGSPGLIAAPSTNLPEFATPGLAVLAGLAAFGGVVVFRRRRDA